MFDKPIENDTMNDTTKEEKSQSESGVRLILASRSPRRQQLLAELGIPFWCIPSEENAETAFDSLRGETPEAYVQRQAYAKAQNVAQRLSGQDIWILGCDTVAIYDDEILGKPLDRADARRMLRKLSGSVHAVISGLCLHNPAHPESLRQKTVTTQLEMEPLSDATLEAYLDSGKWAGKAGAFGFQDGNDWLKILSGSATNVVGLPMETLTAWLKTIF